MKWHLENVRSVSVSSIRKRCRHRKLLLNCFWTASFYQETFPLCFLSSFSTEKIGLPFVHCFFVEPPLNLCHRSPAKEASIQSATRASAFYYSCFSADDWSKDQFSFPPRFANWIFKIFVARFSRKRHSCRFVQTLIKSSEMKSCAVNDDVELYWIVRSRALYPQGILFYFICF